MHISQHALLELYGYDLENTQKYRIIHKSLRDFGTRMRNNQDRHERKEHINT